MKRFWDTVIEPVLEATRPKSIVEIGSDKGINTRNLLAFLEETDNVLHVIDPVPKYDVSEWQKRYGERFVFHQALSLDALPSIDRFDLVLVDGDHNWYTVYNELRLIEERCAELSQPFPLVILHDVDWPFGRRDLYYDPDTIPEDYRKPHGRGGIRPGVEGLLDEGGIAPGLEKAASEGGPRNGVFTAVEDFLEGSNQRLRLVRIPGFHGLALLVPPEFEQKEALVEVLKIWELPSTVARHIDHLEESWLEAEVRCHEQQHRYKEGHARLREKYDSLRERHLRLQALRREDLARSRSDKTGPSDVRRLPNG